MSDDISHVENLAREEYPETGLVSAGAAARQLCRSLGLSGHYPRIRLLLEDMLAQSNKDAHEISHLKRLLGECLARAPASGTQGE